MTPFTPVAFLDRADALFTTCGGEEIHPLAMQTRVAQAVATRSRVLVVQPTGGGKTLAAALPFATGFLAPKQMLFLTPLRALASQQATTLGYRAPGDDRQLRLDANAAGRNLGLTGHRAWDVRIQTGIEPADPLFEADAVVCTFDQALSSALAISYSASARRRTVNAGAFLTSYIVADELHLFLRDAALTTLLWFLRERPDLPFCLMTATLTTPTVQALADFLGAAVVDDPLSSEDRATLGVQQRARIVTHTPKQMTADDILHAYRAARADGEHVLVVVNTVERAIALGRALHGNAGLHKGDNLLVLHSRFYPEDRAAIERKLAARLGKNGKGSPTVVIATQVVEVGLDISAAHLLTDLAPANALVQRWGRCARWGGTGTVRVFAPPEGEPERTLPYAKEDLGVVLARTADWLHVHSGLTMDDDAEKEFLNAAHGEEDERWADEIKSERVQARTREIGETIADGKYPSAGILIRKADGCTVLVHGRPDTEITEHPFRYPGFRLSQGMLFGLLRRQRGTVEDEDGEPIPLDVPDEVAWRLKALAQDDASRDESERGVGKRVSWRTLDAREQSLSDPLYVLNPRLASYDEHFGLSLRVPQPLQGVEDKYWSKMLKPQTATWEKPVYERETLVAHVRNMLRVLNRDKALWPRVAPVAGIVDAHCGWPDGMLQKVVKAAILLHDIGKLTPAWQDKIRKYQESGGYPYEPWLVHTDGVSRKEWYEIRLEHALGGAAYSLALGTALDSEAPESPVKPSRVLFTAIATHHSPALNPTKRNWRLRPCELLDAAALSEARRLVASFPRLVQEPDRDYRQHFVEQLRNRMPTDSHDYGDDVIDARELQSSQSIPELLALLIVTRLLRLADGWSQEPERLTNA